MGRVRTSDDVIALERCKEGDREAFGRLVQGHRDQAYKWAYLLCRNHEEAEDILSQAILRAYRSIGEFKGEAAFSTWLYRIILNCYKDLSKNAYRRNRVPLEGSVNEDGEELDTIVRSDDLSPHDVAVQTLQRECLLAAIDRLLPEHRQIILLYHAQMLSYEEIAEMLKIPVGTVKSRINRARLALREKLEWRKPLLATTMPE